MQRPAGARQGHKREIDGGGGGNWGHALSVGTATPRLQHTALVSPEFLDLLISQEKPEAWMSVIFSVGNSF